MDQFAGLVALAADPRGPGIESPEAPEPEAERGTPNSRAAAGPVRRLRRSRSIAAMVSLGRRWRQRGEPLVRLALAKEAWAKAALADSVDR